MKSAEFPIAILAGGMATRLKQITAKVPKLLLDVAGEPFFSHQIKLIKASGLNHIVLCVGHLGEKVVEQYGDGSKWGVKIEYSFDGPRLLGTGGALIRALPLLDDTFYVLYGDSYLPFDYRLAGRRFIESGKLGLMTVFENRERFDTSNVWFDGAIRAYDKKNRITAMRHIDYGLQVFSKAAFEGLPRNEFVDLSDVQTALLARNELAGYEVRVRFFEIGSPTGLLELNRLLRNKE